MNSGAPREAKIFNGIASREQCWNMMIIVFILWSGWMARDLRWSVVWEAGPFLLKALAVSWMLALISIALGSLMAVPLAAARVYGPAGVRHAATAVIEVLRATPELMIIFWIFFALPGLIGLAVSSWTAAVTALSVIAAAYLAEVVRGGFYSVSQEQWDGGSSTGLSRLQVFTYIILPQAVRNMVPALIAQLVALFKTTTLVYVVGIIEFFRAATIVNNTSFAPFALYLTLAVGYFSCSWVLTWVVRRLDPKYLLIE